MSYQLLCQCGRMLNGNRKERHQIVPCPGCGQSVFVLPRSVFAPPDEPKTPKPSRPWWVAPVVAGILSLAVFAGVFFVLWPYLMRPSENGKSPDNTFDLKTNFENGKKHLRQGNFHLARQSFDQALRQREKERDQLTADELRELAQFHRQADLFARLLSIPLAEIVRQARLTRDAKEWTLAFATYREKCVIFDDLVGLDGDGRPTLAFHVVEVGDERVRVALEDLTLLRDLPLSELAVVRKRPKDESARLVFGARLAACEREQGGDWVIRLQPDSGVLLTDHEAVTAGFPRPPDEGMKKVLEQQKEWLEGRMVMPAARP